MRSRRWKTGLVVASAVALGACGFGRLAGDRATPSHIDASQHGSRFVRAEPVLRADTRSTADRETMAAFALEHQPASSPSWAHDVAGVIYAEARTHGLDPLLVAAVMSKESSFRAQAISQMGAMGLMQVRPFVGEDVALRAELDWVGPESLHEPETNVRLGTRYLAELLDRFDGNVYLALAAYHRGPTRVSARLANGIEIKSIYAEQVLRTQEQLTSRRSGSARPGPALHIARATQDAFDEGGPQG